jgi:hypothetical protein
MRLFATMILAAAACAPALPQQPIQRALVRDLARVVETRDQIGWFVDDYEMRQAMPEVMDSVCRVDPAEREAALAWLDERMSEYGGSAKAAWLRADKDLDAIPHPLLLERTRTLLRYGHESALEGKCPFWLEPEPDFDGRQDLVGNVMVAAEYGGRFYAQYEGNKPGLGGGGTLRVLAGLGVHERLTVLTGIEAGGAGRFTDIQYGERVEVPAFLIFANTPLIFRFHDLSTYYEIEAAMVTYTNQLRGITQFGGRIGGGIGVLRTVLSGVLPGLTLSANFDYVPAQNGLPAVRQLGAGIRGVFILGL